jgi:cellulose synthase/poly-beta-1,6-N-acetylglucosamine synthase-like glycosyltransferase
MLLLAYSWVVLILSALLAVPTAVFCCEIIAGVAARLYRPIPSNCDNAGHIAVLVPAHNESSGLIPTLEDIKAQLRPRDRLVVVADNCNDDTAEIARAAGAEVAERNDLTRVGKGYALDWGLRYLEKNPPEILVMVDADCRLGQDSIINLIEASARTGRPTQALYLMQVPSGAGINRQVAGFAWRLKNWVRPLGFNHLGLPCQLMGTGMAFPWRVIRAIDLASGWIVEDLKLGLDLAAAGHPPLFCPLAEVTSHFAATAKASVSQRSRWVHGHMTMMAKLAPRFLSSALAHGNVALLMLTLDLMVPPLSVLAALLILTFALAALSATVGGGFAALTISAVCGIAFAATVAIAWAKFGRDVLPLRAISSVPIYILAGLGLCGQLLSGRKTTQWIKTDRTRS